MASANEDEIDAETLQAQIDMSMSFTHELVSSWVKPSSKLASRKRTDARKELEEAMKRPAR